jgi:hypothetical protein
MTGLCQAIQSRWAIKFIYDGCFRLAEPYLAGSAKSGKRLLRAYQLAGQSQSGQPQGWKLFDIDEMTGIVVTDQPFILRPEYNPNDRAMYSIYCRA